MTYNKQSSFYKTLNDGDTLEILETELVQAFSISVVSGTAEVKGAALYDGEESETISVPAGLPLTEMATQYSFLYGYTITAVGGITIVGIRK